MDENSFIKEVVKEKPINKKIWVIRAAGLILGGALFGLAAAISFDIYTDQVKEEPTSRVRIEGEEPEITGENNEIEALDDSGAGVEVTENAENEDAAQSELVTFEQIYQNLLSVSQETQRAVVTVSGIVDGTDWFKNTYENQNRTSGVIIAQTGQIYYILTEYRAVDAADRIQVTFWDDAMADATLIKNDRITGLCVLSVSVSGMEASTKEAIRRADLGSSYKVNKGDPVMILGNTTGHNDSLSYGMVTSDEDKIALWDKSYTLFVTDIQGIENSSGVMMNLDGEITGIVLQNYSNSSNMVTCLGISEIKPLIETLSNNMPISYTGIKGQDVTQVVSDETGMPMGVYIDEIEENSPAMLSGLMSGDIIVQVKGMDVKNIATYSHILQECESGEVIRIKAMRRGAEGYGEVTFDVTVESL